MCITNLHSLIAIFIPYTIYRPRYEDDFPFYFFPIFISSFLFFHVFPLRQQQAFSNDIGFVSVSSEVNIFLAAVHIWARRNISIYSQFIYAHAHGKVARAKMLNSDSRRNNFNNFFYFPFAEMLFRNVFKMLLCYAMCIYSLAFDLLSG